MRIRPRTYVLPGIVLLVIAITVMSRRPKPVVPPLTETVKVGVLKATVSETASVESVNEIAIAPVVSGKVASVFVRNGQRVTAGTVLFTLDDAGTRQRVEQAGAQLARAQASLALAERGANPEEIIVRRVEIANAAAALQSASATLAANHAAFTTDVTAANTAITIAQTRLQNAQERFSGTTVTARADLAGIDTQIAGLEAHIRRLEKLGETQADLGDEKRTAADVQVNDAVRARDIAYASNDPEAIAAADAALRQAEANRATLRAANALDLESSRNQVELLREQRATLEAQRDSTAAQSAVSTTDASGQAVLAASELAQAHAQANAANASALVRLHGAESALVQAQGQLASAEAQLAVLTRTQTDIDLGPARADVEAAKATLGEALANVSHYVVTAPRDGTVTQVTADAGEAAAAFQPVLSLVDLGNLRALANVSETEIGDVVIGQRVDMTADALPATQKITGRVTEIESTATVIQGVIFYRVRISFDRSPALAKLRPGMTLNIEIETASKANVLVVPTRALRERNDGLYVAVYRDGITEDRKVTVGLRGDEGTEVLSGVKAGENVVTFIPDET